MGNFLLLCIQMQFLQNILLFGGTYGGMSDTGPVFLSGPVNHLWFLNSAGGKLDCSGHGFPDPQLQWTTGDGHIVEENELLYIHSNGSLVFKPFEAGRYDAGVHSSVYKCVLSNVHGKIISTPAQVTARINNNNLVRPRVYDSYIIQGNTAVLKCNVPSYASDWVQSISWFKDDQLLTSANSNQPNLKHLITKKGNLHVFEARADDELSEYKCQIKDLITGQVKRSENGGKIHITYTDSSMAPSIEDAIPEITAKEGEDVLMPCAAQGQPPPTYKWRNVKEDQYNVSRLGWLNLKKVTMEHEGTYECIAQNSFGSDRRRSKLIVKSDLQAFILPERQILDVGNPLRIKCSTSGHPIERITWRRNGRQLKSVGPVLLMNETGFESVGSYQCFVSNAYEAVQASTTVFPGDMKPSLLSTFSESILRPDASIHLECKAKGKPTPDVVWFRDGHALKQTNTLHITRKRRNGNVVVSRLGIERITSDDGGEFKCVAQNRLGSSSFAGDVKVYGLPKVRPMKNITVVDGQDVNIRCYVTGYPIEQISWSREGQTIRASERFIPLDNGSLMIKQVKSSRDQGKYTCTATNPTGHKSSSDVWISVSVKPIIYKPNSYRKMSLGNSLMVNCHVTEGDLPISLDWQMDNKPIALDLGIMVSESSRYSFLQIDDVKEHHSGNYTCIASNVAGEDQMTLVIDVKVPPKFVNKPTDKWGTYNEDLLINCNAEGNPKPKITWMFKHEVIRNSNKYEVFENGSILVKSLQKEDEGAFTCRAENGIDPSASADIRVFIGEPLKIGGSTQSLLTETGKDIELQCQVTGLSPLTLKWYTSGKPIEVNDRYKISNSMKPGKLTSNLKVSKISSQDPSRYECVGQNRFDSKSRGFQIDILKFKDGNEQEISEKEAGPNFPGLFEVLATVSNGLKNEELNEAPVQTNVRMKAPARDKAEVGLSSASSVKGKEQKITFLQILIASTTTAVIILLFVLLLVLIILWKRRSDKRENEENSYRMDMVNAEDIDCTNASTLDRRYGQLAPKFAKSCETLSSNGYYSTIAPYATFNPQNRQEQENHQQPKALIVEIESS